MHGLRELGPELDVRLFRCGGAVAELWLLELLDYPPSLVFVFPHHDELPRLAPFLAMLRATDPRPVVAACCFDDPYDMETGLALAHQVDFIFSPEPLCVDVYARNGTPAAALAPFVDPRMHNTDGQAETRAEAKRLYDVFHLGGNWWKGRREILPPLRAWCSARQLHYGECAGRSRWVFGRELSRVLHQVRVLIDIPRWDLPTRTNPEQIPCTYTGPRTYIAAACGTFVLHVGPRPDLELVFPGSPRCTPELLGDTLEHWLAPGSEAWRAGVTSRNLATFVERHQPVSRAALAMLELSRAGLELEAFGLSTSRCADLATPGYRPGGDGPLAPPGSTCSPAPASADAPTAPPASGSSSGPATKR